MPPYVAPRPPPPHDTRRGGQYHHTAVPAPLSPPRQLFYVALWLLNLVVAAFAFNAPARMPVDIDAIFRLSTPLALAWAGIVIIGVAGFGRRSLWMMLTAPAVLYWPIWLAWYGIPECYIAGNCN